MLFVTAPHAAFGPEELAGLAASQARITVSYETSPQTRAALAQRIDLDPR